MAQLWYISMCLRYVKHSSIHIIANEKKIANFINQWKKASKNESKSHQPNDFNHNRKIFSHLFERVNEHHFATSCAMWWFSFMNKTQKSTYRRNEQIDWVKVLSAKKTNQPIWALKLIQSPGIK